MGNTAELVDALCRGPRGNQARIDFETLPHDARGAASQLSPVSTGPKAPGARHPCGTQRFPPLTRWRKHGRATGDSAAQSLVLSPHYSRAARYSMLRAAVADVRPPRCP